MTYSHLLRTSLRPKPLSTRAALALMALAAMQAAPARADDLSEALTQGTVSLLVRPRVETVDQTGKQNSEAATVRTMLGYATKTFDGFSVTVQLIDVAHGGDDYNSLINGETRHANIPDPGGAGVNQAFLQYSGLPQTNVKLGRQILIEDDERFVGKIDFRQTMQTFDAASFENSSIPMTKINASYVWGIKNILNQYVPTQTYLAEASVTAAKFLKLDGFGYWYGNVADRAIPGAAACGLAGIRACDSATYGVRASGVVALPGAVKLGYEGTYATQRPYDGGSSLIDADYWHVGAKLTLKPVSIGLDDMMMGSNSAGSYGFQTPLATRHAFNGWAETFLTTPAKGLDSKYVTLGVTPGKATLLARYYVYHSDDQNLKYGNEWDLSAGYQLTSHLKATAEYADYRAQGFGLSTKAAWAYLTFSM